MKNQLVFMAVTSAAVVAGFAVGYGVGKETRAATPSNVDTQYSNGVVTITANVGNALKDGVSSWLSSL